MRSAAFAVDSILCVFGVQDQCKNDQNQFKFNWNSNKMRSAAFAGKQNLVFLTFFGVQGLDKAFPFKWNTRVFIVFRRPGSKSGTRLVRLGCPWKTIVLLQQGAIFLEKPCFCCNRYHFPRKTMVLLQQGTIFLEKPFCIILSGKGSRVEDLRFVVVRIWILSSEKNKITKWNLSKTIG